MQKQIISSLKPFDILLHNTPFCLTDWLIPGFFTHASVYLGRPEDLQQFLPGFLWQDTCSIKGQMLIESNREGVLVRGVDQFLDCDSLVVLRDPHITQQQRRLMAQNASSQIGKKYEYGFSLETKQRQFCAKLVADLFQHIPFLDNLRNSPTLLPDHIGQMALRPGSNSLQAVELCLNGICLPRRQISAALASALTY
ncbi:MAG: hypothetical protein JRC99_13270 [Deltaproteobacteria bacterium]|nr:hypothetical protein [Deltaproteobacteria bacterium]